MKTILVPSDFSANAATALRYAIRMCSITHASLLVFHCSLPPAYVHSITETEGQRNTALKNEADKKLKELRSQVNKAYSYLGLDMEGTTKIQVEFNPFVVEKTLDVAQKNNVSLIVMGTHGASGTEKFLFGSNTSIMISKSGIPVLAIPAGYRFNKKQEDILFASDFENFKTELGQVTAFASEINAVVRVIHFNNELDSSGTKDREIDAVIKENKYSKITLRRQDAGPHYSLLKELRKYIAKNKPGCLVMFTRERSFWKKIFQASNTEDMASALPLPLLSFKRQ